MKNIILITIFLTISHSAIAGITGLFGIELGKPFPNYSGTQDKTPVPFLFFRVPVPQNYEIPSFNDFEVRISKKTNNVFYIEAERAYSSQSECMSQLVKIEKHLKAMYGTPVSYNKWSSPSGNREARANCVRTNNSPFDVLTVVVFDKSEYHN